MNRIRELRKEKGLTMKELGRQIGLAESTVSLYERGLHEPDHDTLRSLSAIFSVTVDYLLGNDVPGHVPEQEKAPSNDPYYQQVMAKAKTMNVEELKRLLRIMDAVEEGR